MSKLDVALLPSVDIIYIPTVYIIPPSPRYSRFPPFFLWTMDYGGPCSGGSNIKKGFFGLRILANPKNSKFPNPKINIAFSPITRLF